MNNVCESNTSLQVKDEVLKFTGLQDAEWCELMFDNGCLFAEKFSKQFQQPQYYYNQLVKLKLEGGKGSNFFWSWWRFKWILNDKEWLLREAYAQFMMVDYEQWKQYMLEDCKHLQKELMEDLTNNSIQH